MIRYVNKFTNQAGTIEYVFPRGFYEVEPRAKLDITSMRAMGVNYPKNMMGTDPGIIAEAQVTVRFEINGTPEQINEEYEELESKLYSIGWGYLWSTDGEGNERFAFARLSDELPRWRYTTENRAHLPVAVTFDLSTGFWQERRYTVDIGRFDDHFGIRNNGARRIDRAILRLQAEANYRVTSGTMIRDATRRIGTSGDGYPDAVPSPVSGGVYAPKGTVGLWRGSTNLITNGGFETNATGWTAGGTNTIARDAADTGKFGDRSGLATYQNNVLLATHAFTATAAAHSGSVWVKIPSAWDGGGIEVTLTNLTGATGVIVGNANMSLRDQWQRIYCRATPVAGDLSGTINVRVTGANPTAGRTVNIDGIQVELGVYPTPYIETDGGTAARVQPVLVGKTSYTVNGRVLSTTTGYIAARIRVNQSDEELNTANLFNGIWEWRQDATHIMSLYLDTVSKRWTVAISDVSGAQSFNSAVQDFAAQSDHTLIFSWSATQLKLSVNGGAFVTVARTKFPVISAGTFTVGSLNGTLPSDFDFHWFAPGTLELSDDDAAAIHAQGNTDPALNDLPGNPVHVWMADGAGVSSASLHFTNPIFVNSANGYGISSTFDSVNSQYEWKVDSSVNTVQHSTDSGGNYTNGMANATRVLTGQIYLFRIEVGDNFIQYGGGAGDVDSVLDLTFYEEFRI